MDESTCFISWTSIHHGVEKLVELIKSDDKIPEAVIAVGRGGLIPGTLIAYKLGIDDVVNYTVQSYDDELRKSTGEFRELQKPANKFIEKYKDRYVLVVDDLSDRGHTLRHIKKELHEMIDLRFATLFIKTGAKFKPDYHVHEYPDDTWLTFPWEAV
jgi:xanthine phosphoribosyltransferase